MASKSSSSKSSSKSSNTEESTESQAESQAESQGTEEAQGDVVPERPDQEGEEATSQDDPAAMAEALRGPSFKDLNPAYAGDPEGAETGEDD